MKNIYAIHGAYSSPKSFAHLKHLIGHDYNWVFFDYSDKIHNVSNIMQHVPDQSNDYHVIGHSMGGLIALGLCDKSWVKSITTISCPINGIDLPFLHAFLSRGTFMKDVSKYSNFIKYINDIQTNKPIQHIISTSGFNPWLYEPNDGVVTVRSQTCNLLGKKYEIAENHFEILLAESTANIIKSFVNNINLHDEDINDII